MPNGWDHLRTRAVKAERKAIDLQAENERLNGLLLGQSTAARLVRAETRLAKVAEALRALDDALNNLPSGVDEDADPYDPSPDDATAHLGGLMRHDIRAALAIAQPEGDLREKP